MLLTKVITFGFHPSSLVKCARLTLHPNTRDMNNFAWLLFPSRESPAEMEELKRESRDRCEKSTGEEVSEERGSSSWIWTPSPKHSNLPLRELITGMESADRGGKGDIFQHDPLRPGYQTSQHGRGGPRLASEHYGPASGQVEWRRTAACNMAGEPLNTQCTLRSCLDTYSVLTYTAETRGLKNILPSDVNHLCIVS